MKHRIVTILGEFVVVMSYNPGNDDTTLPNLTKCINTESLPHIQKGLSPEKVIEQLNESDLEKKLFQSITAAKGAGPRLSLNLKKRIIEFSKF